MDSPQTFQISTFPGFLLTQTSSTLKFPKTLGQLFAKNPSEIPYMIPETPNQKKGKLSVNKIFSFLDCSASTNNSNRFSAGGQTQSRNAPQSQPFPNMQALTRHDALSMVHTKTKQDTPTKMIIHMIVEGVKRWFEALMENYDLTGVTVLLCMFSSNNWIYKYKVTDNLSLIRALNRDIFMMPYEEAGTNLLGALKNVIQWVTPKKHKNIFMLATDGQSDDNSGVLKFIEEKVWSNYFPIIIGAGSVGEGSPSVNMSFDGESIDNINQFVAKAKTRSNVNCEMELGLRKVQDTRATYMKQRPMFGHKECDNRYLQQLMGPDGVYTGSYQDCKDLCNMAKLSIEFAAASGILTEVFSEKYACTNGKTFYEPYCDEIQRSLQRNEAVLATFEYGQYLIVPGPEPFQLAISFQGKNIIPIGYDRLPFDLQKHARIPSKINGSRMFSISSMELVKVLFDADNYGLVKARPIGLVKVEN